MDCIIIERSFIWWCKRTITPVMAYWRMHGFYLEYYRNYYWLLQKQIIAFEVLFDLHLKKHSFWDVIEAFNSYTIQGSAQAFIHRSHHLIGTILCEILRADLLWYRMLPHTILDMFLWNEHKMSGKYLKTNSLQGFTRLMTLSVLPTMLFLFLHQIWLLRLIKCGQKHQIVEKWFFFLNA